MGFDVVDFDSWKVQNLINVEDGLKGVVRFIVQEVEQVNQLVA